MSAIDATISPIGLERLDELRPLWLALHHHHRDLGSAPLVTDDAASWAARRDVYRTLLAEGEGFLLGAFADAELVGYAAVRFAPGPDDTFPIGERAAEIYSLVVAPEAQGRGIGSRLLNAVDELLASLGVVATSVAAMVENADAIRLYQRRGFEPREVVLWRFRT
ncbi:MAG TPA: GNAT family N-acetyltransferase [Thermomicrobiales bacterium]|nr:GNAT family N-acetyltransferase [Thermomicrobiales bacterium]